MPDLFSAGHKLASAFGGDDYETAKQAEELRSITRAAAMATTDKKVDEAIRESVKRQSVQSFFNNPEIPQQIKDLTLGGLGTQYAAVQRARETEQKIGFHNAARDAAVGGDLQGANNELWGLATGPKEMVKVSGGQVIRNPWSVDGTVAPTNVALSQAENNYASAGQHAASAALSNARRVTPERFRAGSGSGAGVTGKPGAWTAPAQHEINAYFGDENAQFQPSALDASGNPVPARPWTPAERAERYERIKDFDAWRAANPNIRGGSQALLQYKLAKRGRGAALSASFAGDPTNVGDRKEQAYAAAGSRANGAGTQVPTPNGAITPKVPGVPETKGVTTITPAAPVPGARMAPNGKWYVKKGGTYYEVVP